MINQQDYERELEIFTNDQIKIIADTHNKISENARRFHAARCRSRGTAEEKQCEHEFVNGFIAMLNAAQIKAVADIKTPPQEEVKGVGFYL